MSKVWTGERLETFIYNETTIEHLHRYALACTVCKNLVVLDIASGEGYGSNLLSMVANKVIGVDISKEAVEQAKKKYNRNNLIFLEGSASKIPLDANSVDVVVSFETIEHHELHDEMLAEITRVLKPEGLLIMSSPDKKFYSDVPGYKNPFHVKELYFEEFKGLICSNFKHSSFLFQKIVSGSLIIPEHSQEGYNEFAGDYDSIYSREGFSPLYNLCIASNSELPYFSSSFFDGKRINDDAISLAIKNAVENAVNTTARKYTDGWSYKVGHFLLTPFRFFKPK